MNLLVGRVLTIVGGVAVALGCSADRDPHASASSSGGSAWAVTGGSSVGGSSGSNASGGQAPASGGRASGGGGTSGGQAGGGAGGTVPQGTGGSGAAGGSGGGGAGQAPGGALGMNDVTILVPLPEDIGKPVLLRASEGAADGTPFVPEALFDRFGSELAPDSYERLHLVAVRFDLCDHKAPGPCPLVGDASLRLVFQPLRVGPLADDVGIHAFYAIPQGEVLAALQALRELAALRIGPPEPLAPSTSLALGNGEYTERLRAFVRAYGGEARLIRLAVNAQSAVLAAVTWFFRELEREGTKFEDRLITGTTETIQRVTHNGDAFFDVRPVSDTPPGLARALDSTEFKASSEAEKRAALEALTAIDNPLTHGPDTVACVACHTSTVALATRAEDIGLDVASFSGRYMTALDTSIGAGMSATSDRTVRALGWFGTTPLISQRVTHDTALVLEDIVRRLEER